ncbi:transposase [Parachitinimonas caeni]|uniref:Transposase n=1 Tax=Parachitinimonas caeni TaxID=3031301 RepID=A0ABT7DUI0_9NEIS|nr:transposase [Parachitinimonas caeni]MDK2123474.1 transposase [Parachitinimonas caeni]
MYEILQQSHTTEFKQEAIRLVEAEGKRPAQVARDLGISEQTLGNWRKAHKAGKLATGSGKPGLPEQMECPTCVPKAPVSRRRSKSWKMPRRTLQRSRSAVNRDNPEGIR